MPTAASMKKIAIPVAARPTSNIVCHSGAITPGKPKVKAPGQKTAKQQPKMARIPFTFLDIGFLIVLLSMPVFEPLEPLITKVTAFPNAHHRQKRQSVGIGLMKMART
jgi:hypothetical protein